MQDLHNNIKVSRGLSPVTAGTGDTPLVSQIVDKAGFDSLEAVILTGTITDANVTFTVLVEDGNASNLSDAAAVDDAYLLGIEGVAATPTGASFRYDSDDKVTKIGYIGPKRYVRVTITPSGNTGDMPLAMAWLQGDARKAPLSTQMV